MNNLKTFLTLLLLSLTTALAAEDGSRLWLRSEMPDDITLQIDSTMPDDDGYRISGHTVTARTQMGLLYGRYALLRGEQGESHPFYRLRILNHWDNIDGSIERGYAGSIGVDRSSTGTGATLQYREPYRSLYDNVDTCPEQFLLWFHRVPWTRRLKSGRTVWEELQWHYNHGVEEVDSFAVIWQEAKPCIDAQRWQEVENRLEFQQKDARLWRDVCLKYFSQFALKK